MKKILAFGLIALLFALVSSVAPTQSVPVDKDVGICYVAPMDQTADVMVYVADNSIISLPDSRDLVLPGVEKPGYVVTTNSQIESQCLYDLHYGTPANQMTPQKEYKQYKNLGFRLSGLS